MENQDDELYKKVYDICRKALDHIKADDLKNMSWFGGKSIGITSEADVYYQKVLSEGGQNKVLRALVNYEPEKRK